MAAGNTLNTRTHVLGDMLMMEGTFTDGGLDVHYGDSLRTVVAAGGHVTSFYNTGIEKNGATDAGDTTFTVKTVDMRLHFNIGETVYASTSGDGTDLVRIGVITAMAANATGMTVTTVAAVAADAVLWKCGPDQSAVTLNDGSLSVSVDETNNYVVFGNGNLGAASVAHIQDGRWWILGLRA